MRREETTIPVAGSGRAVTYRTRRVLGAIAELSGRGANPSNREVSHAAGIRDQGQMSKLLARLEGLGLIENTCRKWSAGEPKAWGLTAKGEEVWRELQAE